MLEAAGFEQRVVGPTHKRGHTLDLVLVRHDDSLLRGLPEIVGFPNKISDHSAIVCTADIPKPCATTRTFQCRKLRKIDLDLWNKDLKDSALYNSDLNACTDPNVLTDQYNKVLSNPIELHAPVRFRTVTLRPYSPWYDDNLRSLKRAKRQAEQKYVKSGLEVHRQIFEDQCRIYSDALNSAKQEYYKNQISGSDQRQLFRMIDGLSRSSQPRSYQHVTRLKDCLRNLPPFSPKK